MFETMKVVDYELDGQAVRLTVTRATTLTGTRRSILIYKALEEVQKDIQKANEDGREEPEDAIKVLKTSTYPTIVAGTKQVEGIPWPLSFDEFCELPDSLVFEWENAIFELNPHWNPAGNIEAEQEKKVSTSTGESSTT